MKHFIIILILLAGAALFSAPGDFVKDVPIRELKFEIPEVKREKLKEGLDYYGKVTEEFPIAYLEVHIYGGESATGNLPNETSALFCDVFSMGGSKSLPDEQLVAKIEAMGAHLSCSSEYEKIILSVSYLTRDQETVMNLMEDLWKNPAFSDNALLSGKKKMKEAIKRRNEKTDSLGFRKAREWVFRSFKKGTVPQSESVDRISRDTLKSFFENSVKKNKKAIIASGRFDQDKLKAWINNLFTENANVSAVPSESSSEDVLPSEITLKKLKEDFAADSKSILLVQKDVNQSFLLKIGVAPEHSHPDFFPIQLLNFILGDGFNSYLMTEIRVKRGLAYSAHSRPLFEKDYGLLYFYTATKNETLGETKKIMEGILTDEVYSKITEEELQTAKNSIISQFVFLFTNQRVILENQLSFDEDNMPADYLKNYRKRMQAVTLDDIRRVGKKYFLGENMKTVIVTNQATAEKVLPNIKPIAPEDKVK